MSEDKPFSRSDTDKDARLAQLRQRLAGATPKPPPKPALPRFYNDWRGIAAIMLVAVLLLASLLTA